MPPTGPLPTWRLPHLGSPVSGPSGPQLALVELGGSSPPPGARCWPSGQACRTSAHSSPRPAAAAWGTRTRLGPAELSVTTTRAHTGPELLTSQDGVHTSGVGKPHIYRKAVATKQVARPRAPGGFSRRLLVLVASVTLTLETWATKPRPRPSLPPTPRPVGPPHHDTITAPLSPRGCSISGLPRSS